MSSRCVPGSAYKVAAFLALIVLVDRCSLLGNEQQRLDAMEAAEVVRTFMTTKDLAVYLYLQASLPAAPLPWPGSLLSSEGDKGDLAFSDLRLGDFHLCGFPLSEWPIQGQIGVHRTHEVADPLVPEGWTVYVGRMTPELPWKVLTMGTGP